MRIILLFFLIIILAHGLSAQSLFGEGRISVFRDWSDVPNHFLGEQRKLESAADVLRKTKTKIDKGLWQSIPDTPWQKRLILFVQTPDRERLPSGGFLFRITQGLNAGVYAGKQRLGVMAEATLMGFSLVGGAEHHFGILDRVNYYALSVSLKRRLQLYGPLWSFATAATRWIPDKTRVVRLEHGVTLAAGLEFNFGSERQKLRLHWRSRNVETELNHYRLKRR